MVAVDLALSLELFIEEVGGVLIGSFSHFLGRLVTPSPRFENLGSVFYSYEYGFLSTLVVSRYEFTGDLYRPYSDAFVYYTLSSSSNLRRSRATHRMVLLRLSTQRLTLHIP